MFLTTRIKWLSLFVALIVLAACTVAVKPEWVSTYNHKADIQEDRWSWLQDMAVDSRGDIIVAASTVRTSLTNRKENNLLFVKFNSRGERLWAQDFNLATGDYISDDDSQVLVVDSSDNLYALASQYQAIEGQTSGDNAFLISLTANGEERWRKRIDENQAMEDLKLHNDKLFVTGRSTQIFSLSGEQLLHIEHDDHWARSIAVNDNNDFALAGSGAVSYYSASGERLWHHQQSDNPWASGEVIITLDGSIVATEALRENAAARITRFSADGQQLWTQRFSAARQSYGLPGPALVFEDNRGDLLLTASNAAGHRVVKLDASGRTYWNKTSRNGIIFDAALRNGSLYTVGDGHIAKYNSDGERVAESEVSGNVQITTGSVALDGDRIYAGFSVYQDSQFVLHLSQFINP